jgi:hypothetical protein
MNGAFPNVYGTVTHWPRWPRFHSWLLAFIRGNISNARFRGETHLPEKTFVSH